MLWIRESKTLHMEKTKSGTKRFLTLRASDRKTGDGSVRTVRLLNETKPPSGKEKTRTTQGKQQNEIFSISSDPRRFSQKN
jgi:hypothetical protein